MENMFEFSSLMTKLKRPGSGNFIDSDPHIWFLVARACTGSKCPSSGFLRGGGHCLPRISGFSGELWLFGTPKGLVWGTKKDFFDLDPLWSLFHVSFPQLILHVFWAHFGQFWLILQVSGLIPYVPVSFYTSLDRDVRLNIQYCISLNL